MGTDLPGKPLKSERASHKGFRCFNCSDTARYLKLLLFFHWASREYWGFSGIDADPKDADPKGLIWLLGDRASHPAGAVYDGRGLQVL